MHVQQQQENSVVFHVTHGNGNGEPSAPFRCITVERQNMPLTITYGDKTYILVLTRSNKLLLQKPVDLQPAGTTGGKRLPVSQNGDRSVDRLPSTANG